MTAHFAIICAVNNKHRKTLADIFTDPINGNIEWRKIESLLVALECEVIEGSGQTFIVRTQARKHSVTELRMYVYF